MCVRKNGSSFADLEAVFVLALTNKISSLISTSVLVIDGTERQQNVALAGKNKTRFASPDTEAAG
jgi:hypothetical protein